MSGEEAADARILKKRPKGKGFLVLDVLVLNEEGTSAKECFFEISAAEKPGDEGPTLEETLAWKADLHGGDVIRAQGHWVPLATETSCCAAAEEKDVPAEAATAASGKAGGARPRPHKEKVVRADAVRPRSFRVFKLEVIEKHTEVHGDHAWSWSPPCYGTPAQQEARSAALQLCLVLQVSAAHAARLADYCREMGGACGLAGPQQGSPDREVLVHLPREADLRGLLRRLTGDANIASVLRRIFVVQPQACWTLQEAISRLAALVDAEGMEIRVRAQVHPKYLERRMIDGLADNKRLLDLKRFTSVASLVCTNGRYYVGISPRSLLCAEEATGLDVMRTGRPKSPRVCRAYSKLSEALLRSGWASELAAAPPQRAVDVGASPGGWSACLADPRGWGCSEVCAIDPGELAPELVSAAEAGRGHIRHFRMKSDEAFVLLRSEGVPIDVLVCDANFPCDQALELVEGAVDLLRPWAYLVLTFKDCSKTRADFATLKTAQLDRLRKVCTDIKEMQLLANRKLETTVMARFVGEQLQQELTQASPAR
eukprot:gnl/TRDRNA2_/TRDRNA2_166315_c0_seq1.p1 gnl/TRDRNA2_/TRDRNA2_166315_c0~~gnl/TRDRNA2_/TRDRNA2_166315_c0_seq1.p1  ORF type:complete len:542 (+),score=131.54 gnl/TRDRNA2_/TRDRNA2_166315_c0_seq1:69-1694(+)